MNASPAPERCLLSRKENVMLRIAAVVDELIEEEETGAFEEDIDKDEFVEYLSSLMVNGKISPEKLLSLSHKDLKKRIERVMWAETAAGMLNDLSPEQIRAFDESLKERRQL